eukprot:GHVS01025047.1.p1 GENE.GHVS01025047.1~~GHVS01025047.1.p1  ORF type:complete len:252 (+),score=36.00 GHVS01025047.1:189-944(+)
MSSAYPPSSSSSSSSMVRPNVIGAGEGSRTDGQWLRPPNEVVVTDKVASNFGRNLRDPYELDGGDDSPFSTSSLSSLEHDYPSAINTQHTALRSSLKPPTAAVSMSPASTAVTVCNVVGAVLWWYFTSITMTFVNKYLFGLHTLHFNYQLLVTFAHFGFMSILLLMGFYSSRWFPPMPHITISRYCRFIVPISFFTAVDVALGNEAYSLVGVSTMTVIKSSVVVFTYLLSVLSGVPTHVHEKHSSACYFSL